VELRPAYPLRTARLLLRPLALEDTDALLSYRSLEEVCRFVPFEPMSRAMIMEKLEGRWAQTAFTPENSGVILGVELADSSRLVGDVTLFSHRELHRCAEIGWVFHPGHSGCGYATEAAAELMRLGFQELGLHRIVARVDARNGASLRLAERLGMRREAHLIENEWFKGEWTDEIDFAMLETEWRSAGA
jgi:RimJ/RimL family protein N-acetyltransferase